MKLLLLLPLLFLGCAGFERDWDEAAAETGRSGARTPFPRRWEGQWISQKHQGAGGRLRCILTPFDERQYRAQFRANWLVFTSGHDVLLETRRANNTLHLQGSHRIRGFGGGLYKYKGVVRPDRFTATYDSAYDAGVFTMRPMRPAGNSD